MPASDHRLTTAEMAHFAHDGFLRFDALVSPELNAAVLDELPALEEAKLAPFLGVEPAVATPATSTPLSAYRTGTALGEVFALPALRGIIESLVGAWAFYDGTAGALPLPADEPPYATGVEALADGWFLLQSPGRTGIDEIGGVPATRFVFERRVG
jgi:hypothetical protein